MPTVDERLAILEKQEAEIAKIRADKPPYYLELQLKKNIGRLKRVEAMQKEAFANICKRGYNEQSDEFPLFFTAFLKGEVKSINEYLKRKNFS